MIVPCFMKKGCPRQRPAKSPEVIQESPFKARFFKDVGNPKLCVCFLFAGGRLRLLSIVPYIVDESF